MTKQDLQLNTYLFGEQLGIGENLIKALSDFYYRIEPIQKSIDIEHTRKTPYRIVKSMCELFKGCWEDPAKVLEPLFYNKGYDELIYSNDVPFVSSCAHHNLPFFGKMHFAYLPDKQIVGLSKIPRLVRVLSRRPQIQEQLTTQIVTIFDNVVNPKGCALVVEAYHLCLMVRGIEAAPAYTKTSALHGVFKTNDTTRQEFLNGIRKTTDQIWP
jgi:GTP cyclohydrolase I